MNEVEPQDGADSIRCANCWQDADVLCAALNPSPGKRCLSSASGGDNSFALLAAGADVVAADPSPAQLSLVELKVVAMRELDYEETLEFLGVRESSQRIPTFWRLRQNLSEEARNYWEDHLGDVGAGVIHHGKFEDSFRLVRNRLLPWIHRRHRVLSLLDPRNETQRLRFYDKDWNTLRWRLGFRLFFSRFALGRLDRKAEYLRYVRGSVSRRVLQRTRHALTTLAPHENPYLEYILTGNFGDRLPRFLRQEPFQAARERLDHLTLFRGTVAEAAQAHGAGGFDGFDLSDVFDRLPPQTYRRTYGALLDQARPKARLAYWNRLAPRACPIELRDRMVPLQDEGQRLFARDKAFFYGAFTLEEVA